MVDTGSLWTYLHQGIDWIRNSSTEFIPVHNDITLLIIAVGIAWVLKKGRIIDTVIFISMIVLIFLLLKMG